MRGKTISIFIPDSNPRGVKICDIRNSIVKATYIPRSKLDSVINRDELQNPGVYFLIGKEEDSLKPTVYIGEAETLLKRLKQHNSSKDFWNTAICFTSEKRNINKAHIKYLESHCCSQAQKVNKCKLANSVTPTQSSLTESDVDFVLSFFDDLKVLIATLGFPIFEESKKEKSSIFTCKSKGACGEGEYSEDGMTVFKGAITKPFESKGISEWVTNLRESLKDSGVLAQKGESLVFIEDYTFSSPSAAAGVILGRNANGWTSWKDKHGVTMDEKIRKAI